VVGTESRHGVETSSQWKYFQIQSLRLAASFGRWAAKRDEAWILISAAMPSFSRACDRNAARTAARRVDIGDRFGIRSGGKEGAPHPDITSVEAFKRTLLTIGTRASTVTVPPTSLAPRTNFSARGLVRIATSIASSAATFASTLVCVLYLDIRRHLDPVFTLASSLPPSNYDRSILGRDTALSRLPAP
jgi:hypothetical protein